MSKHWGGQERAMKRQNELRNISYWQGRVDTAEARYVGEPVCPDCFLPEFLHNVRPGPEAPDCHHALAQARRVK